jgi:hypothetical protein
MHHAPATYRERRRKLTPEELASLPGLYRDGSSIRAIAKRHDQAYSTTRARLVRAGVRMRPQFGAQTASRP